MSDQQKIMFEQAVNGVPEGKSVSRREFLKIAGVAGAAVGVGAGLGGLFAGCGEGETTTTAGGPTTTAAASTTTVSVEAEMGPEVKIGFVTPRTGGLAPFGVPDSYTVERVKEWIGDGQVLGDNKKHPISIEIRDTQSDVARAGQVTGELIGAGVQIMITGSGPDTVNPVADQCEGNAVPMVATDNPWQAFIFGRQGAMDKAFKWTYLYFFGVEDVATNYVEVWRAIPTNMKVGVMWPNDADGAAFSDPVTGFPPKMKEIGLNIVDPGRWQPGTEDYTAEISLFKKEACEVLSGVWAPPDFTNFWKQCKQQGWSPKIATIDKAILFPQSIEALGAPPIGIGLISGNWWSPSRPWKSYFTGETCREWADEFTKRTKVQWSQPLMHAVGFEMAIWALQHATDPTSKESIVAAIQQMKFQSMGGDIDFTAPVATEIAPGVGHIHPNVYKSPFLAGQWVEGTGYPYEYVVVNNAAAPFIPVDREQIAVPA